jgi:predicted RNA-binding Zn-ribbon protein involved in translation (DUF1610 family)
MPIQFECPYCGRKLRAADSAAGKTSSCPGCGGSITAPEPVYEAELVPEPPPASSRKPSADDDLDDGTPYALEGFEEASAPPGSEPRRPCPMCGELIVATAAKCRFCGEIFDPALRQAQLKKQRARGVNAEDTDLSAGEWVFGILCGGIACIVGIVWMIQGKPKGWKLVAVSLVSSAVFSIIQLLIEQNLGPIGPP